MSIDSLVKRIDEAEKGIETSKEMIEDARELTASIRNTESYEISNDGQWTKCKPEEVEETTNDDGNPMEDAWDSLKNFQTMMERNKDSAGLQTTHTVLEGIGLLTTALAPIPGVGQVALVTGVVADGANAGLYLLEGQETKAGIAAAGMIPGVGELKAATRLAKTGGNFLKTSSLFKNQEEVVQRGRSIFLNQKGQYIDTKLKEFKPVSDVLSTYGNVQGAFETIVAASEGEETKAINSGISTLFSSAKLLL